MTKADHLDHFYDLMDELRHKCGGLRYLGSCNGRMDWPQRGVYFFFEPGEQRSSAGLRVVRVGTHGLKPSASSTLWKRLSQHRGTARSGAGNHRGSIFRLLVGTSYLRRESLDVPSWGVPPDAGTAARKLQISREALKEMERPIEIEVSKHICALPFLWLEVNDQRGPDSLRGVVERNSIALLSNFIEKTPDIPSLGWLGNHCDREKVRSSGLWNNDFVECKCEPGFLDTLERLISAHTPSI